MFSVWMGSIAQPIDLILTGVEHHAPVLVQCNPGSVRGQLGPLLLRRGACLGLEYKSLEGGICGC